MPTITTDDGTNIYYEWSGSDGKPVLVFSNSLGSHMGMWDDQIEAFSPHFRILRYDDRGHGRSDAPNGPYTLNRLGQDVVALLDALSLDKIHWCGLSKGGMLGMWLATNHPARLERLVLADTSPHMPPPEMWNDRARAAREEGLAAMAPTVIERWFTEPFRLNAPERIAKVRDMLETTPGEGYAGSCEALRDMDQRAAIKAIAIPTLVVVGEDDPATPPEYARLIHDSIAGSRLEIIPAAAHLSNIEQTERFNEIVLAFLTS